MLLVFNKYEQNGIIFNLDFFLMKSKIIFFWVTAAAGR